jgi:Gram-negative bacterial TonB protein C-terminal
MKTGLDDCNYLLNVGYYPPFFARFASFFTMTNRTWQIMGTFLLLLCSACRTGGDKAVFLVVKKGSKPKQISEQYHVLRSDKKVKHGLYTSYFYRDKATRRLIQHGADSIQQYVKERGTYVHGQKHGYWVTYDAPGRVHTEGAYDKGKPIGIWRTTWENGTVTALYDHDKRQRLTPEVRVVVGYPREARKLGIQGIVQLRYQADAACNVNLVETVQSVHPACDKAAVNALHTVYRHLRTYGPHMACNSKVDTFRVRFHLE